MQAKLMARPTKGYEDEFWARSKIPLRIILTHVRHARPNINPWFAFPSAIIHFVFFGVVGGIWNGAKMVLKNVRSTPIRLVKFPRGWGGH